MTVDTDKFTMKELDEAMGIIKKTTSESAKVFYGLVDNKEMGDDLRITLVATGLRNINTPQARPPSGRGPVYTTIKHQSPA